MVKSALSIDIQGISQFVRAMRKNYKDRLKEANESTLQAARFLRKEVVLSIAGQREEPTSVDTGNFKSNIEHRQSGFMAAEVFTRVPYSIYLEKGTRYIQARQHFGNSLERNKEKINKIILEGQKQIKLKGVLTRIKT